MAEKKTVQNKGEKVATEKKAQAKKAAPKAKEVDLSKVGESNSIEFINGPNKGVQKHNKSRDVTEILLKRGLVKLI